MRYLIINARIFDGSGSDRFAGEVLIEGNQIAQVARSPGTISRDGCDLIDAEAMTLMPGMVESHAHLSFPSTVDYVVPRRDLSVEERVLRTAHTARTLLDAGFTSAYSGGSYNARAEVVLRDAIAAGWLAGPRLKACSYEKNAAGAQPDRKLAYRGVAHREPDTAGVSAFVSEMADLGVDAVKFVMTGESGVVPGTSRSLQFFDEEIAAASAVAHARGIPLSGHCHSAEAVKMAVRHGFRAIYHCTWADDEAVDLLEAHRGELFVSPSPGINYANCYEGEAFGVTQAVAREQEQFETLERVSQVMPKLKRRGVRVLPGGDYGFPWNPNGKNARDLDLFVRLFGFSAPETLRAATKEGGELMGLRVGEVRSGFLADLLLVDGNPLDDITLLQQRSRLMMIMQDGKLHKMTLKARPPAATVN